MKKLKLFYTTKFPEQRIKYEMIITLLLKSLDHLFVWRSPAEITIMAVARFCWPDVAIYEDNCNVLVITAVQFSTEFQEKRFYIYIIAVRLKPTETEVWREIVWKVCIQSQPTTEYVAVNHNCV